MDTRLDRDSQPSRTSAPHETQVVHLTRWVNEPLPDLRALLSASEISRLTRRPRWLLLGLAVLGRFPKRRTHCGKPVGWHRADVLDWLTQNMTTEPERPVETRRCRHPRPMQACLPLGLQATSDLDIDSQIHDATRGVHR